MGCASISSLVNRTRPNWYGGLGAVVAIAGLFGLAGLVSDSDAAAAASFVVLPLLVIWTIVTSVFMSREV